MSGGTVEPSKSAEAATPSTIGGDQPLNNFLESLKLPNDFLARKGGENDPHYLNAVDWLSNKRPMTQNFWPGLALAYIWVAESCLINANKSAVEDPFSFFEIEKSTSSKVVNTLNFIVNGKKIHSRPAYQRSADIIRNEMRREHPSAAPHATQAWTQYKPLITSIFAMSPSGRARFAEHVWQVGVIEAVEHAWSARDAKRIVRPFEKVLFDFDTTHGDRGGALFQALVFGYFHADSPNLSLESHSVNTGSKRANMPGDVAGFRGDQVELAVEVKDLAISTKNVEHILINFLMDLEETPNTTAVIVGAAVDEDSRARMAQSNVIALSREDLRKQVVTWDLPKQQEALRGAIYFLARIQKRASLTERLVRYLRENNIGTGIIDDPSIDAEDVPIAESD